MKRFLFLSLGLLILISSCRKDKDITTYEPPIVTVDPGILIDYEPTVIPITGSVDGFVTDETGDVVQGAQVRLGAKTTVTNEDGHFSFLNTDMNEAGTLVQVIASGYFDGSRRFLPTGNGVDRVYIQLLQKVYDQSFNSATGGNITIPGGTGTIVFKPNTVVDANGDTYTGAVDIAVKYLDPSAEITSEQMPGNLFGVNENLEERSLATYGMVAVELVDNNGNLLNLGEDAKATINMPVPASMQANAPTTIPLWYYNEQYGVWVQEGEGTLTNGVYIGEVTHFSWWNYDDPFVSVDLTMTLVDQNGLAIPGYTVTLTSTTYGTTYGVTNSQGIVKGLIPAGEVLIVDVYDKICITSIHTQNIGPFTNSNPTVSIAANVTGQAFTTIVGVAECGGTPLNDYLMKVTTGNFLPEYVYGSSSTINWSKLFCGGTTNFSAKIINLTTLEESNLIPITGGITNNIGTVDACQNQLQNYFSVNLDGNNQVYLSSLQTNTMTVNLTSLSASVTNHGDVSLSFAGSTTSSYPNEKNRIDIYHNNENYGGELSVLDVIISGSKVTGTFGGNLEKGSSGIMVPVSGHFDIDFCGNVTETSGTTSCTNSEVLIGLEQNGTRYFQLPSLDFGYLDCSAGSSVVTVYDIASKSKSAPINLSNGSVNSLGNVDACQTPLTDFIELNFDGKNYLIPYPVDSLGMAGTSIHGWTQEFSVGIEFAGATTGSYPNSQNQIHILKKNRLILSNTLYSGSLSTFDVTTFSATKSIGSFSGSVMDSNGNSIPVSGNFESDF